MDKKLSIIIPVYNGEKTLIKCLDSIPERNDIEIICIDDCSTDNSLNILNNYFRLDLKILKNETNKGIAYTTNVGIDNASCKGITGIDDDDYVITENYSKMIDLLDAGDKYDFVGLNNKVTSNKTTIWSHTTRTAFGSFVVKKEFVGDTRFPEKDRYTSDGFFTNNLKDKKPKQYCSNLITYIYDGPRENSVNNQYKNNVYGKKQTVDEIYIGIISYLPNDEPKRSNRRKAFLKLLNQLDTYFHLPIVIIAQNGRNGDYDLEYNSNEIKIYSYKQQLGITKARAYLRDKLLLHYADYYIFLDDDTNITTITQNGVNNYLNEIKQHPNMVGEFRSNGLRLYAISRIMLEYMNWNYLLGRGLDATKGNLGEDTAYVLTYRQVYKGKFFKFSRKELDETFIPTEKDPNSTGFGINGITNNRLFQTTKAVAVDGAKSYGVKYVG